MHSGTMDDTSKVPEFRYCGWRNPHNNKLNWLWQNVMIFILLIQKH